MCEYCGCQQITVIGELTAEHDRLRELGSELATVFPAALSMLSAAEWDAVATTRKNNPARPSAPVTPVYSR